MKELEDLANWIMKREADAMRDNPLAVFEGVKLTDLPKNLSTVQVLSKAIGDGLIEFGRPDYASTHKIRECVYGKLEGEKTITYDEKLQLSTSMSWTNLKGPKCVKVARLLAEDAAMDDATRKQIGLWVRLTEAGTAKLTDPGKALVGV